MVLNCQLIFSERVAFMIPWTSMYIVLQFVCIRRVEEQETEEAKYKKPPADSCCNRKGKEEDNKKEEETTQ